MVPSSLEGKRSGCTEACTYLQSQNIQIQFLCKISFAKTRPYLLKKIEEVMILGFLSLIAVKILWVNVHQTDSPC